MAGWQLLVMRIWPGPGAPSARVTGTAVASRSRGTSRGTFRDTSGSQGASGSRGADRSAAGTSADGAGRLARPDPLGLPGR